MEILVSHHSLTELTNQKKIIAIMVQPTIETPKKNVLKPLLIDFC
ncbi:hypothetical protein ACFP3I_16655 [Chryseobacterium arachidis]